VGGIALEGDAVAVGDRFSVAFQRTLRVPADGSSYPLPPSLGRLPVARLGAPEAGDGAGFGVPLYQREALWLAFGGAWWKPNAVQIGVGGVNALSGQAFSPPLTSDPQNYLVCPDQPWLDGINAGKGFVRQFVAVPLGSGLTVEGRLTGTERLGGIQLRVYEPKPGRFPDHPPDRHGTPLEGRPQASARLGLAAGGTIAQKIYPDPYGVETWDPGTAASVSIALLNSEQFQALTGREPPPSPVSAALYTEHGLPWFHLYEEAMGDIDRSELLAGVDPLADDGAALTIDPEQVRGIAGRRRPGG